MAKLTAGRLREKLFRVRRAKLQSVVKSPKQKPRDALSIVTDPKGPRTDDEERLADEYVARLRDAINDAWSPRERAGRRVPKHPAWEPMTWDWIGE